MCGIAGRVDHGAPGNARLVSAMTDAISHRGPDDHGLLVRGGCALGHRRLSIVDLSGGHQPLCNEDGSVWVVFNGEIYNHASIRADLESKGHVFKTRSDTEAIVHAYEEDGPRCVERFRGMFAFAIWDHNRRRLVLARDRLGIKPVYYAHVGDHLTFASEVKALLLDPSVDRRIDEDALACYLSLRYVPAPATMLRGVRKLPPATTLVWESGHVTLERYWDLAAMPTVDDAPPTEAEATVQLRELMDDCVEMRLMSEVPLGTFLSGGVDSTAVTASILSRHRGSRLNTFAVGYHDEQQESELDWARLAARALDTEHHEVDLSGEEAARAVPELIWQLDEPLADPAAIPLYFLSQRTRKDVTVVLSGEGGDEIFAGYSAYQWMTRMETLRRLPGFGAAAGVLGGVLPVPRLARAARLAALPLEERYRGVSRAFDDPLRRVLLGGREGDVDSASDRAIRAALDPHWSATRGMTPLRRMLYLDSNVWLPDDLLMKADKMTMATAVELRVPLLDHKLVEFAWSLPDHFKLRNGEGKYLLRRAVRGRIPDAILDRPKKGFATPTAAWLRRTLAPLLRDALLDGRALGVGRFHRPVIERLLGEHQAGQDRSPELWSLLCRELWHARLRDVAPLAEESLRAEAV